MELHLYHSSIKCEYVWNNALIRNLFSAARLCNANESISRITPAFIIVICTHVTILCLQQTRTDTEITECIMAMLIFLHFHQHGVAAADTSVIAMLLLQNFEIMRLIVISQDQQQYSEMQQACDLGLITTALMYVHSFRYMYEDMCIFNFDVAVKSIKILFNLGYCPKWPLTQNGVIFKVLSFYSPKPNFILVYSKSVFYIHAQQKNKNIRIASVISEFKL